VREVKKGSGSYKVIMDESVGVRQKDIGIWKGKLSEKKMVIKTVPREDS
jgi:hypothetical protein